MPAAQQAEQSAHVVFEAIGRSETYQAAFEVVRPGGVVVGFGGCPPGSEISLDLNKLHYSGIRFVGSYHYQPGTFERALALIESGDLDVKPLLTHRIPLADIGDAVRIATSPRCLVPVIEP